MKEEKKTSGCNVTTTKTLVISFAPDFASEGKKKDTSYCVIGYI